MILMCVAAPMAEDDVGAGFRLQLLKPRLDLSSLIREEPVLEGAQIDRRSLGVGEKLRRRLTRLLGSDTRCAEHGPVDVQLNAALNPAADRSSGPDFDVVGVGADAENLQRFARAGKADTFIRRCSSVPSSQRSHCARATVSCPARPDPRGPACPSAYPSDARSHDA